MLISAKDILKLIVMHLAKTRNSYLTNKSLGYI